MPNARPLGPRGRRPERDRHAAREHALGAVEIREALGQRSGTVAVLDALGIALEEKTRVKTAILGAVARSCRSSIPTR